MEQATTDLLKAAVRTGSREAVDRLFAAVYDDLRAKAHAMFRAEPANHTLQPTALVHEAFLRLIDQRNANWQDRVHFCAVAALVMRRILVDHARKRSQRGIAVPAAAAEPQARTEATLSIDNPDDVLLVNDLIEELRSEDENHAKIVELRFFGGLTVAEVAGLLGMSKRAVEAEWTLIRAMIRVKLSRVAATGA